MVNTTDENKNIWSLLRQGESFLQLKEYGEAEKIFNDAIENLLKTQIRTDKKALAWAYAHRGEARRLNNPTSPDVLDDFSEAIRVSGGTNSKYAWAYAHWGETYRLRGGGLVEARKKFDEAIKIEPDYTWAIAHRGASYDFYNKSELQLALKDFDTAIKKYPNYVWAIAYRSIVRVMMGDSYKGYYDLLTAIRLDNTIMGREVALNVFETQKLPLVKPSTKNKIINWQDE